MATSDAEREAKLPVWAQELIADLRKRVQTATEPLIAELARLRPWARRLKAQNDALTELLEWAARGGHKTAQEIMEVIQDYDLTLTPRQEIR